MTLLFIIMCAKTNIIGTPLQIFAMAIFRRICHGYLSREFSTAKCCGFFAEVIFHGFLLWEFAAAICK